MSTIAQQIHEERKLAGAPRVPAVSAAYTGAVAVAFRHARARLALPAALPIIFVFRPAGNEGETWQWPDGRAEILINVGLDSSPRRIAWVVLHECKHVHDGHGQRGMSDQEAEDGANAFAHDVTERPPSTDDFYALDWRRPSGRLR